MRKVMIGTPCYDGRIDVWYVNSLVNTIKMAADRGVEITPMWVSFDALIQRARNDTIQIALEGGFDDLIWIDSDIEWQPEWFFKLLDYPQDVVGGTYRKKGDREEYVLRKTDKSATDPTTGLIEVSGLGTGFVKMSKSSMQYLWDISQPYMDPKDNKERRMIFDVVIKDLDMVSEDITAFMKLVDGGFKIWLDPKMTCNHIGPYKFKGDFVPWFKNGMKVSTVSGPPAIVESPKLPQPQFKLPTIPKRQL
jgi:glycosyltransferase involved in cell wall biosynthesis